MLSMGQISNIKKTKADASFYYVDGRYFGDANGDGRISSVDLTMLRGFIMGMFHLMRLNIKWILMVMVDYLMMIWN